MVESFVRSLHVVFLVGVPVAALAFLFTLLLKEIPLTDRSSSVPTVAAGSGAGVAPGSPVADARVDTAVDAGVGIG